MAMECTTSWADMCREMKYLDTSGSISFDTGTANSFALNIIPQGVGVNSRVGKKASLLKCSIHGVLKAGINSCNNTTLLLVYDRAPNAQPALPLSTDVLNTSTAGSQLNRNFEDRFQVIRRWAQGIVGDSSGAGASSASSGADGGTLVIIDEDISLYGAMTEWTAADTTGAVANMLKGSLFLLGVGDAVLGADTPVGTFHCRVDFDD